MEIILPIDRNVRNESYNSFMKHPVGKNCVKTPYTRHCD